MLMTRMTRDAGRHVLFLGTLLAATISLAPLAGATATRPATVQATKPQAGKPGVVAAKPGVKTISTAAPARTKSVKNAKVRYAAASPGISCVPFARAASGITVKGNAANWWDAAAGVYERGSRPEPGSVLNFRATGSMRLGHVAVVTQVVNSREVMIDHANWAGPGMRKGQVARSIPVVDVSDGNDWSRVKVARGHGADFGRDYPTYGFIYDRPDRGTMVANTLAPAPRIRFEEVAEARGGDNFSRIDAPYRSVR